jgi:hypothetical protein
MSNGGGAATTVTTGCAPFSLAVDDTSLYCNGLDYSVRATSLATGATTTLTTSQPMSGLAIDSKNVYWTTYYGVRVDGENYTTSVLSIPIAGGALAPIATKEPLASSIAVDASAVYFLTFAQTDPTRASSGTWLMKSTLGATTAPVPLAKDDATASYTAGAEALAIDATNAYWTADDSVRSAPLAGGTMQTLVKVEGGSLYAIVVDDTFAYFGYFTLAGASGISRVQKSGGAAIPVTLGEMPTQLAVDASFVYWTSGSTGRISRAPKS